MLTRRIAFVVLGATLCLCTVAFGENSTLKDEVAAIESRMTSHYAEIFPSRSTSVYVGNLVMLHMVNHYENMTSCVATLPDGQLFDVFDATNDDDDYIRSFDQCGVLIRANQSSEGTWWLNAMIGEDLRYYGTFYVSVLEESAASDEPNVIYVQRGESVTITAAPSTATSCRFVNPTGEILSLNSGTCRVEISTVTNAHEGYWIAMYTVEGRMDLIEEITEVVIYDDSSLNATITTSDNDQTHLLCSVRAFSSSICQFVKPDGTIINMVEAIGDDRYLYYGGGTHSSSMLSQNNHQCGITILNPDSSDYGSWKCIVGTDSGFTGSILRLSATEENTYQNLEPKASREKVHVIKGERFEINCNINAELKYCWMRSPNGTAYTVSSSGNSQNTLQYTGMGLPLGDCGAVVPVSEDTDEGEWRCMMGISGGQEVWTTVDVTVTDTILVPAQRLVTADGQIQLSCYVPSEVGQTIDYCRWIGPDGFSILQAENSHYILKNSVDNCQLQINDIQSSSDTGEWTCVAGLVGSSVEVLATIRIEESKIEESEIEEPVVENSIRRSQIPYMSIFLMAGIASTIVFGTFMVIIRKKLQEKNARKKPDLPPKYEENTIPPPPPMNIA